MKKTVLLALAIVYTSVLWALNGLSISQRTIGNGLESQSLNKISKDRLGRLWVGSDVGLSVISNGTVTNIREIPTSEGGLVMLGNVNNLVCTESVLLSCDDRILHYDPQKGHATTLRYGDVILQTSDFLLEGDMATFFDVVTHSIYNYNMKTGECRMIASFPPEDEYNFIKILRSESDSTILYLGDDLLGIYRFNRSNANLEPIPGMEGPIVAKATTIDRSNMLWISRPSKGLYGYYINSDYELIAEYNTHNCDIISDFITNVTYLPNGNLLLGHYDEGVSIIDRRNQYNGNVSVTTLNNLKNVTSTLVNEEDRETLYSTYGYGLISIKRTFIGQIRHLHENEDGIINFDNYISAFEEPEGTVILGTIGNGICRIDLNTHTKTIFNGSNHMVITSMCRFDDERVLVTDVDDGPMLFNRITGTMSSPSEQGYEGFDRLTGIKCAEALMTESEDGDIFLFNTETHHYVYRRATDTLEEIILIANDGMPVKKVENICTTPYAVYVTYRGSIFEIDYNTLDNKCIYLNKDKKIHNITSIAANSQGELFFTEPEGLHRFDPRSNFDEILVETWGNGRFMNVAIDNKDHIWFTTNNEYIHYYDLSKRELLMYSVEDGVPSSRFLNQFAICTKSGQILFPDADGLVTINTEGSLMTETPPVQVSCISANTDKKQFTDDEIRNSLKKPLRLSYKYKEFDLEFSANSFNPTFHHLVIFNIVKDDMVVKSLTTTNTVITLPRLDSGKYDLIVRQAYRRGLSEPTTILKFSIRKPFFETIPGVLVILAITLLFGYTIARFSSNVEKNRLEKALAAQDIKNREDKISFLSNIAHELRTPLSLIYNPIKDFLQEKSVDGIDYERMERIFNQVNKMTVMVNMILDSSRADINKADILIEEVNLNEWINFLLEDYRIDCYAKGFSLKFIMDNSIGTVSLDKRIVETGLSNMLNNSIKYSKSGSVITVITTKSDNMIRVSVKDQGRGFTCDPEDLFKRYYRDNIDKNIPGYGLGLPYARLQLSLIGGNMSAINNPDGLGSTFYMEFPSTLGKTGAASDNEHSGHSDPVQEQNSTDEGMAQDFDTNDMTIMFVCADKEELDALTGNYGPMFHNIISASNGKDALEKLYSKKVDMVISDVEMPEMDGIELCRTIKSTLEISHIPVILLTSRTDERNKSLGYKLGADAFIPKPYDYNQMYILIRSQLGGRFEIKRQYNFGFFSKMNPDQAYSIKDEEFISTLNNIIDRRLSDPSFSEEEICKDMGLSLSVMNRKMGALLDIRLSGYINKIRISIVKYKITDTDESFEDIARETGFSNVDDMNKIYKRETGKNIHSLRHE